MLHYLVVSFENIKIWWKKNIRRRPHFKSPSLPVLEAKGKSFRLIKNENIEDASR